MRRNASSDSSTTTTTTTNNTNGNNNNGIINYEFVSFDTSNVPPPLGILKDSSTTSQQSHTMSHQSSLSPTSSASMASIISMESAARTKHGGPLVAFSSSLHSNMMMTTSSMTPSPSGSMSISLASLQHHFGQSHPLNVGSVPTRTLHPSSSITPVAPNSGVFTGTSGPSSSSSSQQPIYFSSTTSEPGAYHHIRRAPNAIRHFGGSGERFCLPKPRIYRVLYPYSPQQLDELELQYGDLLTVTIQCDDGWFLGRSTLSGKFGTFPGNYVEPVWFNIELFSVLLNIYFRELYINWIVSSQYFSCNY